MEPGFAVRDTALCVQVTNICWCILEYLTWPVALTVSWGNVPGRRMLSFQSTLFSSFGWSRKLRTDVVAFRLRCRNEIVSRLCGTEDS